MTILLLFIFVLAIFLGLELITKVPSQLHTPLMSGSNAISGITLVGAILASGLGGSFGTVLGTLAVVFATVNVIGGYLVTFGDRPLNEWDDKTIIAALLALLAAFSWGSSTVLGKHALKRLSFTTLTALRLTITGAITFFALFSTGQYEAVYGMTLSHWKFLLIIVLSTGSLALFIYYYGLNHLPASHVTLYELFWPLSAVAMDWFIRGNIMSPFQMIGATLLLSSIILLSRENRFGQTQ